jgi:hypothetical protein
MKWIHCFTRLLGSTFPSFPAWLPASLGVCLLLAGVAPAETMTTAANRWAFIICGHPGDEAHRKQFADSATQIRKALVDRWAFPADHVWLRFGVDEKDEKSIERSRGPATKVALATDAVLIEKQLRAEDELWVFVIGHAHHADRKAQFNVAGPDVTPDEFARWFASIPCRRSVFFITTPLSGFFTKLLARQGRVVITATEPDLEVNETLFPSSLAKLLETFPAGSDHDIDKDGIYSLLDVYLATALDVEKRYSADNLLATEHAQLDDNGDGRGSELQAPYYANDDIAAKPASRPSTVRPGADGALARAIDLGWIVKKTSNSATEQ